MVLAVTIEVPMSIIIRPTYMYVHIYLHMEVISRHIRITGWVDAIMVLRIFWDTLLKHVIKLPEGAWLKGYGYTCK